MTHRTSTRAFQAFRQSVQDSIACFAHSRVTGTTHQPDRKGRLTLNSDRRMIEIECAIGYRIENRGTQGVNDWRVATLGYIHSVSLDGERVAEFHWHPDETSNIWYPHIHPRLAGSGRGQGGMHIPSGRIFVEDVLLFAHERGAVPLKNNWSEIVDSVRQRIAAEASWGTPAANWMPPPSGVSRFSCGQVAAR